MRSKIRILIFIIILSFIINIRTTVSAKYIIEYSNIIGKITIDRKPPKTNIKYSTTEPTSENVIVTITVDEPIQEVQGWNLSEDKTELKKIFEENKTEKIEIMDMAGNTSEVTVKVDNIDKIKPNIEIINIKNTNEKFENYANSTHKITFRVKVIEPNIIVNKLTPNNLNIKVKDEITSPKNININLVSQEEDGIIYDIEIGDIEGNGYLYLIIKDSIIMDIGNQWNDEKVISSGILIDNEAPIASCIEKKQDNGKSNIIINSNEKIRELDGWEISEDGLEISKEFTNNVSYCLVVEDYAQNKSKIDINVKQATYIELTYASHNSEIGWTFGYGNNDIAGLRAIQKDPKYKTEALAFNIEGNIDKDFIKIRTYIYTHWGEGSQAKCVETGMLYNYGYNPSSSGYKSMLSDDLVNINGKKYFQFGGSGINGHKKTDTNGNNPIPSDIANKYLYGISGIQIDLKDYSYYSIVYQIYVDGTGWINAKSNGELCMLEEHKPMSALRISLIPKTEEQKLITLWNIGE